MLAGANPVLALLQDFVKLARWEDRGYYANRVAAEKAQRQLHRLTRRAGELLRTPVAAALAAAAKGMGFPDLQQLQASLLHLEEAAIGRFRPGEQQQRRCAAAEDEAQTAHQLVASASDAATRGGAVVEQVVSNMKDISASSHKIAAIIGVIDGIAFQTNILALNAAVEAARAGEQGRGFAVVASEVRALAQRSAGAANEIKTLIGTSVSNVESGARLVSDAGATMREIVSSVQRVSDVIGEITAAAVEQSSGIGQVNLAVNEIDEMTQQNAALVEQSAAAAESLKDQAQRLSQAVGQFNLGAAHMA